MVKSGAVTVRFTGAAQTCKPWAVPQIVSGKFPEGADVVVVMVSVEAKLPEPSGVGALKVPCTPAVGRPFTARVSDDRSMPFSGGMDTS